jgi:hypothetical protein
MEGRGVLLSFTVENLITVTIMAALGYMLFAAITQFFKNGGVKGSLGGA